MPDPDDYSLPSTTITSVATLRVDFVWPACEFTQAEINIIAASKVAELRLSTRRGDSVELLFAGAS